MVYSELMDVANRFRAKIEINQREIDAGVDSSDFIDFLKENNQDYEVAIRCIENCAWSLTRAEFEDLLGDVKV